MRQVILIAALSLLAGCASQDTYWVHTHNNQQRAAQDKLDCEQQALLMYPRLIVNQQITPPSQTPSTISCSAVGRNITCDEFGGRRDPGVSIPMDANNRLRGEAFATCLRTKGYQLMSNEQIDRANSSQRTNPQGTITGALPFISETLMPQPNPTKRYCQYAATGRNPEIRIVPIEQTCPPFFDQASVSSSSKSQNSQSTNTIADVANIQPTFVDTYKGKWNMRYTGPETGRCEVDIGSDGRLFGRCFDDMSPATARVGGSVRADGRINALIESGATIEGRFISQTSATGQWKPRGVNAVGEWIGTKVAENTLANPTSSQAKFSYEYLNPQPNPTHRHCVYGIHPTTSTRIIPLNQKCPSYN